MTEGPTSTPIDWPYPLWIAHRGAGKLAPENTLAAFRIGAAHGFRAFECDAKLTADGVAVLLHDATLERTTNGQGLAGAQAWSSLALLDAGSWHSRAFAGEPLASLEAVARFCLRNGFALNIEIKPTPGSEAQTGREVARKALALWSSATLKPLLSSFRPEALAGAKETAPELPRALLLDSLWAGWGEVARELACVAVVANHKLIDADLVEQLLASGMRLLAYTVNEPEDTERLLALGLDGLITDAIDRFSPSTNVLV